MVRAWLYAVAFVLLCTIGCRPEKKVGKEMATRKECNKPSFQCYVDCDKRNASKTCDGCCGDQRYLCDTGQMYNFEPCKDAP